MPGADPIATPTTVPGPTVPGASGPGAPAAPQSPAVTAPPSPLPTPEPLQVVGRLQIPAIGIDDYVVQGVARASLKEGPGHFPESPLPGQLGNSAIAGHRTTYGAPFGNIDRVKVGDDIVVDMRRRRLLLPRHLDRDRRPRGLLAGDPDVRHHQGDDHARVVPPGVHDAAADHRDRRARPVAVEHRHAAVRPGPVGLRRDAADRGRPRCRRRPSTDARPHPTRRRRRAGIRCSVRLPLRLPLRLPRSTPSTTVPSDDTARAGRHGGDRRLGGDRWHPRNGRRRPARRCRGGRGRVLRRVVQRRRPHGRTSPDGERC